jgi:hypothetical protein
MNRREFVETLALGLLAAPLAVEGQQEKRVARLGILMTAPPEQPVMRTLLDTFRQALREFGYAEGAIVDQCQSIA